MDKYFTKEQVMNAMGEQNLILDDIWGVEQRLDELPTADVVEVVRCKDCKYAKPYAMLDKFDEYECTLNQDYGEQCTPLVMDDDFCSNGK